MTHHNVLLENTLLMSAATTHWGEVLSTHLPVFITIGDIVIIHPSLQVEKLRLQR